MGDGRQRLFEMLKTEKIQTSSPPNGANGMSDPPSRILRRGRHRRVRAGRAFSDEGRSERVRAANEFQIVEDLEAALQQFAAIAQDLKK